MLRYFFHRPALTQPLNLFWPLTNNYKKNFTRDIKQMYTHFLSSLDYMYLSPVKRHCKVAEQLIIFLNIRKNKKHINRPEIEYRPWFMKKTSLPKSSGSVKQKPMKSVRKIFWYFLFKARSIPWPGEPGMAKDERELTHRTQHTRPLSSLTQGTVHRKKRFASFPSPAGMSLTKLPLGRNNSVMTSLFPTRESLVVTSRLGTGNSRNLFFTVYMPCGQSYVNADNAAT